MFADLRIFSSIQKLNGMRLLPFFIIAIPFLSGCGNDTVGASSGDTGGSIWPDNATERVIDTSLVITNLSNEQLDKFQPVVRTDLIKLEPAFRDAELGKTINSATKNIQGNLLKYNFTQEELNVKPLGHVNYEFKAVKDIYDLVKKFNLDVSASVKYLNFRGSAKYELAKSLKINRYHEYIAARVYVEDREEALKEAFIKPEAAELARTDKRKFVAKYGDQVITSKVVGGDIIAVIEIESGNSAEQEVNNAYVAAAFKAWGAKAKVEANMQNALEQITNTTKYSIRLIHNGVFADSSDSYSNIASLKELIDKFPQRVRNSGKVLEYKTSSIFSAVQDLPTNIDPEDFMKIDAQSYQLGTLENNINALYNTLPDLAYVIENPESFTKGSSDSARIIYNRNYQAARAYEHNWKICATVAELCSRCTSFEYKAPDFRPTEITAKEDVSNTDKAAILIKNETIRPGGFYALASVPAGEEYRFEFTGKIGLATTCYEPFISRHNSETAFASPSGPAYPVIELKLSDDDGTRYELLKLSDKIKTISANHGNTNVEYGLFCYFVNQSSTNRQCYAFRDCERMEVKVIRQR
jgi:hypothetical protein